MESGGRLEVALLLLVAALAAAARLLHLGTWSIELDEALFLADARHSETLRYPLAYRWSMWVWDLFNREAPDEFLLRLPSAIAGILAVPATYLALRNLLTRRAAAIAALLVALSSWALFWSQMARFYTLVQLLGLVAGGLALAGVRRGSWAMLVLGLGVLSISPLAHPSAAFLGLGLWAATGVLLLFRPVETGADAWMRRAYLTSTVVALVAGVLWARDIAEVWAKNTHGISSSPLHLVFSTGYFVTPWVGLAFLFGGAVVLRSPERGPRALLALLALAGGAAVATSFLGRFAAQYVFVLLPWIAGLAAVGLERAWFSRPMVALVALLSAGDVAHYHLVRHGDRPRWREAAEYVLTHAAPGDLCLGMHAPALEYYLNPGSSRLREPRALGYLDRHRHDLPLRWSREGRRTWLIVNEEEYEDWIGATGRETHDFLHAAARRVQSFPIEYPLGVRDLDVTVWVWSP